MAWRQKEMGEHVVVTSAVEASLLQCRTLPAAAPAAAEAGEVAVEGRGGAHRPVEEGRAKEHKL